MSSKDDAVMWVFDEAPCPKCRENHFKAYSEKVKGRSKLVFACVNCGYVYHTNIEIKAGHRKKQ
jgi:uncharacterized Zn finger protein